MSVQIPSFRTKDPNDVEPKNFDASGSLARLGNPAVLAFDVFVAGMVVAGPLVASDGSLAISDIAYDTTTKRVSFVWAGGTVEQTYRVTCRLTLSPTWSIDQSGDVTIAEH